MTIYEKNLKTLAKYYPGMDVLIEEAKKAREPELEVCCEDSIEGKPILRIKKEDKDLYLNGKRDTDEAAKLWVQSLGKLQRNAAVLMMGIGNWQYLKELSEQTENRLAIIIYEPSLEIFLTFLELADIERWMEKHLIVFWVNGLEGMEIRNIKAMLEKVLSYEMLMYAKYLVLPNYDILFAEEAVEFVRMCRDIAMNEVIQYNTKNIYAKGMVKNLFSNARFLVDSYMVTQLVDVIPRNIPGILVAAGPSLNKNMEELKKAKGKAFIIAVDTAVKPLLRAGIVPDMFAIIDGLKPLELVQVEGAKEIPLIANLNSAPAVLDYHTGMKFFFSEGYQFAERIFLKSGRKLGDVSTGGSVATTAFSLLYKIGLDTIILVGQDLAYTNNKSHADGTFREVMKEEDTSNFMMVEGTYEDLVPTTQDMKLFIDWYEMYIEGCKEHKKGFRVINATEGGAKLKGTENMTLREAIEQECKNEVDIQECLKSLPPMLNDENRAWAIDMLKHMPEDFCTLAADARKIKKQYQKLDKLCARKNIDQKEYRGILKKLEQQIQAIERKSVYQLVEITMTNAKYILKNEQFLQKSTLQKEGKEIARKGILYMENVENLANAFQEYSEEVFGEEFDKYLEKAYEGGSEL